MCTTIESYRKGEQPRSNADRKGHIMNITPASLDELIELTVALIGHPYDMPDTRRRRDALVHDLGLNHLVAADLSTFYGPAFEYTYADNVDRRALIIDYLAVHGVYVAAPVAA